ncbi:MAG: 50S ribosomal protein L25 [candidate division WOR-3 bacterium]|nr:50S ribosomal protein L25 [candidate division WOR-3 bacterium]
MQYTIKAEARTTIGKSANRSLRRNGLVPAVIYGRGEEPQNLVINEKEFSRLLEKIKGHSPILDMELAGKPIKCVIKLIQRNPITLNLLHVDFQKVHAREKISVAVPIILKGSAQGIKAGGILDHRLREIPIRAEVDKIPEHVEVDITELKLGHSIHVSDLKLEGVEFTLPADTTIVSVLAPRKVEEVVAPAAAAAAEETKEPEVITEKKREEAVEEGKEKKAAEKAPETEKEATAKKEKK